MTDKWNKRFYELAKHIANWSHDSSTKVGAIIVTTSKHIVATGYNGIPSGVKDNKDRWERPEKYFWVEHAERNAIYQAAKNGVSLEDCTLYTTTFPCADCARAIIQSGIKEIVTPSYNQSCYWSNSWEVSEKMLKEANVSIIILLSENIIEPT